MCNHIILNVSKLKSIFLCIGVLLVLCSGCSRDRVVSFSEFIERYETPTVYSLRYEENPRSVYKTPFSGNDCHYLRERGGWHYLKAREFVTSDWSIIGGKYKYIIWKAKDNPELNYKFKKGFFSSIHSTRLKDVRRLIINNVEIDYMMKKDYFNEIVEVIPKLNVDMEVRYIRLNGEVVIPNNIADQSSAGEVIREILKATSNALVYDESTATIRAKSDLLEQ